MKQKEIDVLVAACQDYFNSQENWQIFIRSVESKATGCGPVYELGKVTNLPNQSAAIADMRGIKYATPHYHNGETEIYFVLEGSGRVVVGGEIRSIEKGAIVVTPPNTAHYVIPKEGLVLVVVNTPPFNPANNIELSDSKQEVKYDHEQFKRLTDT